MSSWMNNWIIAMIWGALRDCNTSFSLFSSSATVSSPWRSADSTSAKLYSWRPTLTFSAINNSKNELKYQTCSKNETCDSYYHSNLILLMKTVEQYSCWYLGSVNFGLYLKATLWKRLTGKVNNVCFRGHEVCFSLSCRGRGGVGQFSGQFQVRLGGIFCQWGW